MPWTHPDPSISKCIDFAPDDKKQRIRSYREAILEAQKTLLEDDERFFLLGEGIDDASGVFGTTLGLAKEFGSNRVIDSPLAENGITGVAMGTAIAGMHPLYIHMRPDFILLSLDQLLNHAAKWSYMSNGAVSVPLTIRCVIGRGWGSAAQHSQSLQALLTHVPGIKVLMPATAQDAKGLLIAAVNDPNPVILFEHRWLYDKEGFVPEENYTIPIGQARICREGTDITVVTSSIMVHEAMVAVEQLTKQGINPEIIDLRSIKPWDHELVATSVKKTGRLVIADLGHQHGGIASEIAATIQSSCWDYLKGPIDRVTLPEAPVPAAHNLESLYFPDHIDITKACLNNCKVKTNRINC